MNDRPQRMTNSYFSQISVIIPTCRRPELLKAAVQSVLGQTFKDFELIIVDDDKASSGRAVAEGFKDERIIYLAHGQNRGAAAARNTGIIRARGRYISFLDDDDLWYPDFLLKMTTAMERLSEKVGVLHCAVENVGLDEARHVSPPRHRGDVHSAMLRGEKSGGIIGLVRREVFDQCGVFDENLPSAQDWDLWIRVSAKFQFDYIPDVLAMVRVGSDRISADPLRAIASREWILKKYADEFNRDPEARRIHLKRLAKLNSFVGRWGKVLSYFSLAARGRPVEWLKALVWIVFERPFVSRPGDSPQDPRYLWTALLFSLVVAVYSQLSAFLSPYVVNDDVCQHIWWMRSFREPGLFDGDLLARYAVSLQNFGILGLYRFVSFFGDPLAFSRIIPLVLLPLTSFYIFRIARRLSGDNMTGLFTAMAFAVTKIYLQHMAGGHAHSFGYPLLAAFLYYFLERRQAAMAVVLGLSVLFFPVVFALGLFTWLMAMIFFQKEWRRGVGRVGISFLPLVVAALFGIGVLFAKFTLFADPLIGKLLTRPAVEAMPELTAAGRWTVWPVENIFSAAMRFAEEGVFVLRALWKSVLPTNVKQILLGTHLLIIIVFGSAFVWWWRRAKKELFRFYLPVFVASGFFYLLAAMVVLTLYAPDRYVSYSIPVLALFFVAIPIGSVISSCANPRRRALAWAALLILIVFSVPLVKNAGLADFSRYRGLYGYLATLPKDAVIAAHPELADGIPLFSKRRVFVNYEMSVPLYDRYWTAISERTRELFRAYYSNNLNVAVEFMRQHGLTHFIVDAEDFGPRKMAEGIYFEPFESAIRSETRCRGVSALARLPEGECAFHEGALCVVSRDVLERLAKNAVETGERHENNCLRQP